MHRKDKGNVDMEAVYQEYAQLVYRFLYRSEEHTSELQSQR